MAPRRRETSAESAARFLASYRPSTRVQKYRAIMKLHRNKTCITCGGTDFIDAIDNHGRSYRGCRVCRVTTMANLVDRARVVSVGTDRVALDMARATVAECLDCVSARINECHVRGIDPEHITNIAWQMLNDALNGES